VSQQSTALVERGVQRFNVGDPAGAQRLFTQALKADRQDSNARYFRAVAYRMLGREADARRDLLAVLKVNPALTAARLMVAQMLNSAGKRAAARRECRQAIRRAPKSAEAHALAAQFAAAHGSRPEARRLLARARKLAPGSPAICEQVARFELEDGQAQAALAASRAGLRTTPQAVALRLLSAQALARLNRFKAAADEADKILAQIPGEPSALSLRAQLAQQSGDRAQAKRFLREAAQADTEKGREAKSRLLLEQAFDLQQRHREDEALSCIEEAATLVPASAHIAMRRAHLLSAVGLLGDSEKALTHALALGRSSAPTQFSGGQYWEDRGDYKAAQSCYLRARRLDPRHVGAAESLSRLYLWRGDLPETDRHAQAALKLNHHSVIAARCRAAALAQQGRLRPALKAFATYLKTTPKDGEGHVWHGEILRRIGQRRQAWAAFSRAEKLIPQSLGLLINRTLLRLAEGSPVPMEDEQQVSGVVPPEIADLRHKVSPDRPAEWATMLNRARVCMSGNLSAVQTFVWRRRLVRHIHYYPRHYPTQLQRRVRFGDADRVLHEFARLIRETPHEGYLHSHRGELYLWLGRYQEAKKDFALAGKYNPKLLWPKVGGGAALMFTGRPDQTLEKMDYAAQHGGSSHIMLPWRGESLRRLGRYEEAQLIFSEMRMAFPFRPSIWINIALTKGALGDEAGMQDLYRRLCMGVPGLMRDAANECGSNQAQSVLEQALGMMRGNRSSWMYTYFRADGSLQVARLKIEQVAAIPANLTAQRWAYIDEILPIVKN
jgi:tetratricopeptide (TPR) repeat protein